ncbi:MAG: hypothetical protein EKK31_21690 [Hyphomicrobiales bacterium]|nr:MAG: hypothetical protein EKK31_21690 [Hyphomicrobiales bacterium]
MLAGFGKACPDGSFELAVKTFSCPEADAEMVERLSAMTTHKAIWRQIKLREPASVALQPFLSHRGGHWGYPQKGQKIVECGNNVMAGHFYPSRQQFMSNRERSTAKTPPTPQKSAKGVLSGLT